MSLNLAIPGVPGDIRSAAQWLDPTVADALINADIELSAMVYDAQTYWTGESGYAFNSAAQAVRRGNFAVPEFVKNVAEVLRAYAGRLERGREDFDDYIDYAKRHGLTAHGHVIWAPTTTLRVCPHPDGPDSPELREWNAYQDRVDIYNDLSAKVGTWWGQLDVWIAEQFGGLVAGVDQLKEASTVYDGLVQGNEAVVEFAFDYADARVARDLQAFRSQVSALQADADMYRTALRSGNPALRAAAEAADPRAMRAGVRALNEMIEGVAKSSKIIPVVGTVIDIVATGAQVASGESDSSALAGLAGGIGGGAAAAGIIAAAGVAIPPVGVALMVGGSAVLAGQGATWAWEAWVPLDTREAIDAGLDDVWDWANPTNWFVDTP